MKDYRLSEIKNHDWNENWDVSDDITKGHREYEFLRELQHDLGIYDIKPRDMIELPYKDYVIIKGVDFWLVHYRNAKKYVDVAWFNTEAEADKFLERLKGDKK